MFDLTSSKLLILGLIALIVVGPKDLPVLLRAIGKYVGLIRRQATEFRQYFDEAMRESDLANLKAEVDAMKRDVQATVSSAGRALEADVAAAKADIDGVTRDLDRTIKAEYPDEANRIGNGHADVAPAIAPPVTPATATVSASSEVAVEPVHPVGLQASTASTEAAKVGV